MPSKIALFTSALRVGAEAFAARDSIFVEAVSPVGPAERSSPLAADLGMPLLGRDRTTVEDRVRVRDRREDRLWCDLVDAVEGDADLVARADVLQPIHVVPRHDFLRPQPDGDSSSSPTHAGAAGACARRCATPPSSPGIGLPSAIMELLQTPKLAENFILDATLAVVDTPLLLADEFEGNQMQTSPQAAVANLFEQQLEYADVVVLNKIDALDENALLRAETRIRERAPNVRFLGAGLSGKTGYSAGLWVCVYTNRPCQRITTVLRRWLPCPTPILAYWIIIAWLTVTRIPV